MSHRALGEKVILVVAAVEKKATSLYEELGQVNTALGYLGAAAFLTCLILCLFSPFFAQAPLEGYQRSLLFILAAGGMALAYFLLFISRHVANSFYRVYRSRWMMLPMLALGLVYPVLWAVSCVSGWFSLPVFTAAALCFGFVVAYNNISWQLIIWHLSVWNIVRFFLVTSLAAVLLAGGSFWNIPELARALSAAVLLALSVFLFLTIAEGHRAEFVIERDDSVGHLFVFESRIDIGYFAIQMVDGAAMVLFLALYRELFVVALALAAAVLLLFLYAFGDRQHYSGQFLYSEIRAFICAAAVLLAFLVVLEGEYKAAPLCLLAAAWFLIWPFQGILFERVLGYGPMSVTFVNLSDMVDMAGFLLGALGVAVLQLFVSSPETIMSVLLVFGIIALSVALLFLPAEASSSIEYPQAEEQAAQPEPDPADVTADSLLDFIQQRSGVLVDTYKLSRREADVLQLLVRGSSAKFIAAKLDISDHTVRVHICHIYKKMGVHSKQALIDLFFEE